MPENFAYFCTFKNATSFSISHSTQPLEPARGTKVVSVFSGCRLPQPTD